jgi:DNA-binding response OmpR family regulator
MQTPAKVLLIEDDVRLAERTAEYLQGHELAVEIAGDGETGLTRALSGEFDVILLDLMLPRLDGLEVCRRLRQRSALPVIMLSARSEEIDRILGLELGADDYLPKPYSPRELVARIRAVLRRAVRASAGETATLGREVQMGKCRLNLDSRKLYAADGSEVAITAMEFDLLRTFAENPNRVLSRDQLLDLAHSKEMEPFDRSIDTRIARIRRKIEADPGKPDCLKTVRGAGYVYDPGYRAV